MSSARNRLAHNRIVYLALIVIILLLLLPFISHYYLNTINPLPQFDAIKGGEVGADGSRRASDASDDEHYNRLLDEIGVETDAIELKRRVKELLTIRWSVRNELRQLEAKRSELLREINDCANRLDSLKSALNKKAIELDRMQLSLEQTKYSQKEVELKSNSLLLPPLRLVLPVSAQSYDLSNNHTVDDAINCAKSCRMHNCFDYSRCSLFSPFLVYFYPLDDNTIDDTLIIDKEEPRPSIINSSTAGLRARITDALSGNVHITFDPTVACVYVVLLFNHQIHSKSSLNRFLQKLPHWAGDGRNHVIVNLLGDTDLCALGVDVNKAILAQTSFKLNRFRPNFDIIIPHANSAITETLVTVRFCPARRKYLATYLGAIDVKSYTLNEIKQSLIKLHSQVSNNNELLFDFVCDEKTRRLCNNQSLILRDSTFALILPSNDSQILCNNNIVSRLMDIITSGAIPVVIGGDYIQLPFGEVIDWSRAVIHLPVSRVTELHSLLRSFADADIIELRRNGHTIYSRYLSSTNRVISTLFALIGQSRLQIPSPAAREEQSQTVFNATYPMKLFDATSGTFLIDPLNADNDENLGPIEPPFASIRYQRNYSLIFTNNYKLWNDLHYDPFITYPSLPTDPLLPSDAKFIGSSYGFRPIGAGVGGSGKEFSEALGGNVPKEQFTIVMLTYEREAVLIDSLQRLKGLPNLNKILVIWNSPGRLPSSDLRWPDVGAPIVVLRSKRNSLNNRFLPYDYIETDAILSMDDDAHLRHDEIVFGFRVWREARDRIVGFPGRYHAWDDKHSAFLYNSNYSCELSMVLTGAAFFHKYYSFLYTHSMPQSIRDKVDEYMNCEDIAMNFLVSHISRKPPIKVTSRWTFRCPGCPVSLSEDDSHFHERHKCINYFVSIYGYMPLLNTQFRADSVLFKTRIPHDKQKCFKFI